MIRIHIKKKVIRDGLYVDYKSQLLVCCCYWRGNMDDRVNALLLETALYRSFDACREILFQIKNVLYTEFRISHVSYNIDNEERNVKKKKKRKRNSILKKLLVEKRNPNNSVFKSDKSVTLLLFHR